MKTLNHGTHIRLPEWHTIAIVGTLNGCCISPERLELSRRRGEPEAWSMFTGHIICSDRGYYEAKRLEADRAEILRDGDLVVIEGHAYRVAVVPGNHRSPRNSDPIKFIPMEPT